MSESKGVVRYSDAELGEFKALIDSKLEKAKEQLRTLQEQIWEVTENNSDEHGGDWMDDSSINSEVEMLNTMAIRQRKYIKDLENALIRIRNKTYGICVLSGELIDKRRLLAVPTTTKSLIAKNEEQRRAVEKTISRPTKTPYVKKDAKPKIITKVIKKSNNPKPEPVVRDEEDEELIFDEEFNINIDREDMQGLDFEGLQEEDEDDTEVDKDQLTGEDFDEYADEDRDLDEDEDEEY